MYRLTIRLDSDGDFGHRSTFVSNMQPEVKYLFNSRKQAIKILKEFYDELDNTISCKITEYNKDAIFTIKDFKTYLYRLLKYFKTILIDFRLGNPEFSIELIQIETEEIHTIKGSFVQKLVEYSPMITLSIAPNFVTKFNWEALWDQDIKEIEDNE